MPDPTPAVTDLDSFAAEASRLLRNSIGGLNDADKARVRAALERARELAGQVAVLPPNHPDYPFILANLRAERSTIQNILVADKIRDAGELINGILDATLDLAVGGVLAAL